MYAVFRLSGFQYKCEEGAEIEVPLQHAEKGSKIEIDEVLLIGDGKRTMTGNPVVENARIEAEVIDNFRDEKVLVYKQKRRTKYRRHQGHRQNLTRIKINRITAPKA